VQNGVAIKKIHLKRGEEAKPVSKDGGLFNGHDARLFKQAFICPLLFAVTISISLLSRLFVFPDLAHWRIPCPP
jgi:hypothetical protein